MLDEIGIDLGQSVGCLEQGILIEPTNSRHSSARHLKDCKAKRFKKAESHRLLVVAVAVVVPTMTSRRGLTVYEDEMIIMRDEHACRIPVWKITNTLWGLKGSLVFDNCRGSGLQTAL